jgi:hypothetical protein
MTTKELEIQGKMKLICTVYNNIPNDVSIDYIEYSPDAWYSDSEVSIDINKQKAIEIIDFLKESFGL